MPIKIADRLPARAVLEKENIFIMTENRALHQDIRPLKIVILNLMPTKIVTETQILRCLSNTPLQIEIELMQTSSYTSKNTPQEHLFDFYKTFEQIKEQYFDGMIITGAPIEKLPFEQVDYWEELCAILEWTKTHIYSTLHICWGAQAGLFYHYGVPKHMLNEKKFGVYSHEILTPKSRLFRGFDDVFYAPHSRYSEVRREDIEKIPALKLMSYSQEAGVYIAGDLYGRQFFVTGHSEYDADTLATEYLRDKKLGIPVALPTHYFKEDDPQKKPVVTWRSHGHLLYTNWLNYFVYQTVPFDLHTLPSK